MLAYTAHTMYPVRKLTAALSMKKIMRYNERFVTTFQVAANGQFSGTLTSGVVNPKRVILYPMLLGTNSSSAGLGAFSTNPLLSPWDAAPAATSHFAAITNLQIVVGGVPQFQAPVNMDLRAIFARDCEAGIRRQSDFRNGVRSVFTAHLEPELPFLYSRRVATHGC
ncbi:unnamed protein product [Phytophthora lilii]|uniref:Unnamed protein product n=1 Tax=Phytophthora lilii TaxID=2077276 RepID=A0A9W6X3G9_9STRA|nr:unnamed protein product [Phytophthora lilii]